jgi:hypothetical protein
MKELDKPLRGLVSMWPVLENVLQGLSVNRVPSAWSKHESTRPLRSWVAELSQKIEFFNWWMRHEPRPSYWLSAVYLPQSFLTGINCLLSPSKRSLDGSGAAVTGTDSGSPQWRSLERRQGTIHRRENAVRGPRTGRP